MSIFRHWRLAERDEIRVRIHPRPARLDPHGVGENGARSATQSRADAEEDVADDDVVNNAPARYRVDSPVHELVPIIGRAFKREVFLGRVNAVGRR